MLMVPGNSRVFQRCSASSYLLSAYLVADSAMAQIKDVLSRLPARPRCHHGYDWVQELNGYRCNAGGHFIALEELGTA
jgi:hypothetical protein